MNKIITLTFSLSFFIKALSKHWLQSAAQFDANCNQVKQAKIISLSGI